MTEETSCNDDKKEEKEEVESSNSTETEKEEVVKNSTTVDEKKEEAGTSITDRGFIIEQGTERAKWKIHRRGVLHSRCIGHNHQDVKAARSAKSTIASRLRSSLRGASIFSPPPAKTL